MKIDELGCLISENPNNDFDGARGDSFAESGRLDHMNFRLGLPTQCNMTAFRVPEGWVRHPLCKWDYKDTSTDQYLPGFLALNPIYAEVMKSELKANWYRLPNGQLINPGFYALLKGNQWLINQTLAAQAVIFKFPYRWSDEKRWFEKSANSSCDYLNWIHASLYAYPWVRNMIPKDTLKQKVRDYYNPEANSDWLIQIYDRFIDECL